MAKDSLLDVELESFIGGIQGKKILVYGSNDCGKTKQCCKFDRALLFMTESGGSAVNVLKKPVTKWSIFKDYVEQLTSPKTFEQMYERFRTIIIDTAENLVKLSEQSVSQEYGVREVGMVQQAQKGNPNGYNLARTDFDQQINKLTSAGYCVIFICHEETIEKENPITGEVYNYVQPKGTSNEKSSMRMLRDLCDFAIYVRPNGIDEEGNTIPSTAICKETKTSFARSRFDIQTFIDPFTAKGLQKAIEDAVKRSAENEDAEIEAFVLKKSELTTKDYVDKITPYIKALYEKYSTDVARIIESELGSGRKITEATDDEVVYLDNILNQLITLVTTLNVSV